MSAPIPLLLVDDNVSNLTVLSAVLEDEGFVVAAARTVEEARGIVRSGEPLKAIIVDRHLGSQDGIVFAAECRVEFPSASIFIYSGDLPEAARMEGIDGWLVKGTSIDDLVERVRGAVKSRDSATS